MKTVRTFVTGERVRVSVPDARALPAPVTNAVLTWRRLEVEVNAADTRARDFFLASTGSRLTGSVHLRTGAVLRHGALGGRAAQGLVFNLDVGRHHLFGSTGGRVALSDLAAIAGRLTLRPGEQGASVALGAGLAWAGRRPSAIAQVVDLDGGQGFLLDIRRARPAAAGGSGAPVAGGRLSRSGAAERAPYLVLDTARAVAYGIPRPGTSLDVVADVMSRALVEAV